MNPRVIWVTANEPGDEPWGAVREAAEQAGAGLVRRHPREGVPGDGKDVVLVLIGPEGEDFDHVGRRWRLRHPGARLIRVVSSAVAADEDETNPPTARETAGIEGTLAVPFEPAALAAAVREALARTRRRQRLRTTLDNFNARLAPPASPGDAVEWRRLVLSDRQLASVLRQTTAAVLALDADERVVVWNAGATELFGIDEPQVRGRRFAELGGEGWNTVATALAEAERENRSVVRGEYEFVNLAGIRRVLDLSISVIEVDGRRDMISLVAVDVTERRRAEEERERTVRALQAALDDVRTLSGLLPICSQCKKVRDDRGYWQQIEAYLSLHSGARFTHGLCPECFRTAMDELDRTLGPET